MRRILIAVLLSFTCSYGAAFLFASDASEGPPDEAKKSLRIVISTDKMTYHSGDKITLSIRIENTGDRTTSIMGQGVRRQYKITCNGIPINTESITSRVEKADFAVLIRPHEVRNYTDVLDPVARYMTEPGKYTVQVSWPLAERPPDSDIDPWVPDPYKNLISNVVEFEILPAEGQTGPDTGHSQNPPEATQGQAPPIPQTSAKAACWPWYGYALIALGVLSAGVIAYFIIRTHKKSAPSAKP
jgi:hypothetical protein